jgi:hypothetical protein
MKLSFDLNYKNKELLIDPIGDITIIHVEFKLHNLNFDFTNINASEFSEVMNKVKIIQGTIKKSNVDKLMFHVDFSDDNKFFIGNIFINIDLSDQNFHSLSHSFFLAPKIITHLLLTLPSNKYLEIRNSKLNNENSYAFDITNFDFKFLKN